MAYTGPIVDPHMHLWDLDRHYYAWLQDTPLPNNPAGDMTPIAYKSYRLDDYLADAKGWNVVEVVHVECGLPPKDQLSETDWLQSIADQRGVIGGIVAGANLDDPGVEAMLAAHAARRNVRGVRQIVNWHKDPAKTYGPADKLLDARWREGFALLAKYGLSFDLQLYPSQMTVAAELADAHPDIPLIINHAGMPTDRDDAGLAAWRDGLAALAERPNVSCKISGLAMIDRAWTVESLEPFVLRVIETFGVERCMFASNFPVEKVHGAFGAFYAAYDAITARFSDDERETLFAGAARRIYRLAA
ncbi:amidohydrolase [Caulobacter segnis]|uniref:Amidohydrolase 2 n=2 Tax=Caulobacter segnis TaxID=88688 RepID=D5VL21_CAUST|nr:amidohydrolase family protein [Caulobacter segnis]ADG11194.1 amidohydrolase 2 [Caulobacter segnis ATCC 21756]AVQ02875.1 amidohydrolase [Caulobacter segnis]